MRRSLSAAGAVALVFFAGFATARIVSPAQAATIPMTAQLIDLGALTSADFPAPSSVTPNLQSKILFAQDGATGAVQLGTVFKHNHEEANEIQYVIEGTGTEWLGDKQVTLKPGVMLLIPKGTPHGGTVETSGHLKIIALKTPPQAATDIHPLP